MRFLVIYDYEVEEDGDMHLIEIETIVNAESEEDIPEPFYHYIKSITPILEDCKK